MIRYIYVDGKWWGGFTSHDSDEHIKVMISAIKEYYSTDDVSVIDMF